MLYLMEFVKGVLIALGISVGFISGAAYIMSRTGGKRDEYEAESLIQPFEEYLQKINNEEQYEQVVQVLNIIAELKVGRVINDVEQFNIKKDTSLRLSDEDENGTTLKVITKYTIVSKKMAG